MDLREALAEFSSLLEIASSSLASIVESEKTQAAVKTACITEVAQLAKRLREISEHLSD